MEASQRQYAEVTGDLSSRLDQTVEQLRVAETTITQNGAQLPLETLFMLR